MYCLETVLIYSSRRLIAYVESRFHIISGLHLGSRSAHVQVLSSYIVIYSPVECVISELIICVTAKQNIRTLINNTQLYCMIGAFPLLHCTPVAKLCEVFSHWLSVLRAHKENVVLIIYRSHVTWLAQPLRWFKQYLFQ